MGKSSRIRSTSNVLRLVTVAPRGGLATVILLPPVPEQYLRARMGIEHSSFHLLQTLSREFARLDREPAEDQPFQVLPQRARLHLFQHFTGERVGQQPARRRFRNAARAE